MLARFCALLAFTAVAVTVSASPFVVHNSPVTIPIARRVKQAGIINVLAHDQARAKALKARTHWGQGKKRDSGINVPVTNAATIYTASVGVGSPPTTYDLIVDTGSSNTWVGANPQNPYKPTETSHNTKELLNIEYGSGAMTGLEYIDTVTIGGLVVPKQGVGAAKVTEGFQGVDGILGVGPVGLTANTTTPGGELIPTVTDNAFSEGKIGEDMLAIFFAPPTSASDVNGEMTFGGMDSSKNTSGIEFVPVTTISPASNYWGIDQSIKYGNSTSGMTILAQTAGIVDTGTTLILLASDAFNTYQKATGAVQDSKLATGLLKITQAQYENLQSLFFIIGGTSYELTPNAQIWPRALNTEIGGQADMIYLIVGDIGSNSGSGLDFINGYTFLERFYSVFDTGNKQVGLAETPFTYATTN